MTKNENRINKLFEELVPTSGKADSLAGELADLAAELLTRHGSRVRYPAVVTEPDGRQYIEEYHGGAK